MDTTLQAIHHAPYGLEHPYKQQPNERFPRDPQAGQPVSLGLVVTPAGSAQSVWALWSRADETGQSTQGEVAHGYWVEDQDGSSSWRVDLPAFTGSETIRYRLFADQFGQQVYTPEFSFRVAAWHSVDQLSGWKKVDNRLDLELTAPSINSQPRLSLSFPAPGQVHLSWQLSAEVQPSQPQGVSFRVVENLDNRLVVETAALQVSINRKPFRMQVKDAHGSTLLEECEPCSLLSDGSGHLLSLRQNFASPPQEGFFGFGERFNALNQRGQVLDVRVFEEFAMMGIKNYIPIPYFISSQGYGLFLPTHRYVKFDLAAENPSQWTYTAELGEDAQLDLHLMASPEPAQIVRAYTDLTGKPALPPTWVFGPWMSGNEWDRQERVMREVQLSQEHGIPATVVVIEAWSDESTFYIWNDARYMPRPGGESFSLADFTFPPDGRWPDPKGMIDRLHDQGMKVLLWQIPVLKKVDAPHAQQDHDVAHAQAQGYPVLDEDGQPYRVRPFWFHNGLLLDFTHPEATDWWLQKRAYLVNEMGIDGFKTDGGEHLWGRGARFANGMRGDEGWNAYVNQYVGAYYRFVVDKKHGDGVTFSRAGSAGAQAFPCHWAGDEYSTWDAFRGSVLAGLNAGLSGIPFWGWDLAGFSGEIPSAELYLRSAAMAAFCPIMQYHMDYNAHRLPSRDRTPWNIAERTGTPEVISIYRKLATLRMKLMGYIEQEARYCVETGEPLMRPLFLDWPRDPQAWQISDQYSFGRALLVAPVLDPGLSERQVYLPEGEWINFWTGARQSGGQTITCPAPLDEIPVFIRVGMPWPGLAE